MSGSELSTIRVAITGTLSLPRPKVAELINATENACFVETLAYTTHYLVCAKCDSNKAKKAAQYGTAVIAEPEMWEYLTAGRFPETTLPTKPAFYANNFPEIIWEAKDVPELCRLTYCDARGNTTLRSIVWMASGRSFEDENERWIGAYDGPKFKTWRADRVIELEIIGPYQPQSNVSGAGDAPS